MNKPPKSELRAKYLSAVAVCEPPPLQDEQLQATATVPSAAPLYEMRVDGRSDWHNIHDAAIYFCMNEQMGIGTRVKDSPSAAPRPMTEEERQKIFELAMSLGQK
ncbi:MAG: hypothetical protein WC551_06580 [Patescibacteria group bacterium]